MKIAFVSQFVPPFVGGIQTHMTELATELRAIGHTVDIFQGARRNSGPARFVPGALPPLNRYDIVHFHGFERLLFLATLRARPRRLVVTLHGGSMAPMRLPGVTNGIKAFVDGNMVLRLLSRASDTVIALHEEERKALVQRGVPNNLVSTIPNGVRFAASAPDTTHATEPYLLFLGRVVPDKRLDLAIETLALVHTLTLKIVGPADDRHLKTLQQIARRHGVENRIEFCGARFGAEKSKIQRNAVANVLFSDYEHQPMSILEAASYGTPSIARDVGGVPSLSRSLGNLVAVVDSTNQAARYAERFCALTFEDRARMRNEAQALLNEFLWPHVAARVEKVYRSIS